MGDPRLNSLHLDPTRRQDYRRAKEVLLQARGNETIYAERRRDDDEGEVNNTIIRNADGSPPSALPCWLADNDYVYPLKVGLNTMGRSADNDVVVEDLYVSRRHCAILMHSDNSCMLHDTASKNGTYLNGSKISGPTRLKPGDEIRICNRHFVFLTREGPATGANPPPPVTRTIAG
jgi:pSer/pThr/pTyr-binding forkhead associated (FHA) protein